MKLKKGLWTSEKKPGWFFLSDGTHLPPICHHHRRLPHVGWTIQPPGWMGIHVTGPTETVLLRGAVTAILFSTLHFCFTPVILVLNTCLEDSRGLRSSLDLPTHVSA